MKQLNFVFLLVFLSCSTSFSSDNESIESKTTRIELSKIDLENPAISLEDFNNFIKERRTYGRYNMQANVTSIETHGNQVAE